MTGRYYAMDRDKRWERTELALDALVDGEAELSAESGEAAVRQAYERGETDEFIKPTLVGGEGRIRDGDSVIFFNFRPDRARQLTQELDERLDVRLTTLTQYQEDWDYPVAFPPARPEVTLASTLAERGIGQLHVAETEKYAHVTYFFNGGEEDEHEGEEHRLVDSPRDVPTYDEKPEMSAVAATDAFVEGWQGGDFGFGIINFANPDMVGHTGVIEAAVKAIEMRGRVPRPGGGGGARGRRRLRDHGRPRQRRPHARARRQPQHRPLDEPGAADRDGRGRRAARGRHPGRRGTHDPGADGVGPPDRDDRRKVDIERLRFYPRGHALFVDPMGGSKWLF